jgi:hypothetical protein
MALKKSELYSSLWSSCDELRGGMDASQYKDYVLVLLFIKYVSDKYAGVPYAPISFKITDLVLPSALEKRPELGPTTRFEFPFNNPKKQPQNAYAEINAGLSELAETTLLFLPHMRSIRWQIDGSVTGEVRRIQQSDHHFEVFKQSGTKTTTSHFLKFDQAVEGLETQRVATAFALDFLPSITSFNPAKALAKQMRIMPAEPGRVSVFFPAEKETSGLRFHLHAPFVPELSRASVKETPVNLPLFQQLSARILDCVQY